MLSYKIMEESSRIQRNESIYERLSLFKDFVVYISMEIPPSVSQRFKKAFSL